MDPILAAVIGVIAAVVGIVIGVMIGYASRKKFGEAKIGSAEQEAKRVQEEAEKTAAKNAEIKKSYEAFAHLMEFFLPFY